jgi:hypothetical protein
MNVLLKNVVAGGLLSAAMVVGRGHCKCLAVSLVPW